MNNIQIWDETIVLYIRENISCSFLDTVMKSISFLGDNGMIWIVITILLFLFGKKQKYYRTWGSIMGLSLLGSAFITNIILKPFFARIRPYNTLLLPIIIPPLSDYSFPSGHTTAAFAVAMVLWRMNRILGSITFLFAILLGFSRIYLALHYTTDVFAGAAIGILSANIVLFLFRNMIK